jgi:pyruvate-formate lyase-activating enzyme
VDIIPFHRYGAIKYQKLGKPYKLQNLQSVSEERANEVRLRFERRGLNAQLGG